MSQQRKCDKCQTTTPTNSGWIRVKTSIPATMEMPLHGRDFCGVPCLTAYLAVITKAATARQAHEAAQQEVRRLGADAPAPPNHLDLYAW